MLNVSADDELKVFFTACREQLPNTVAVDKCHAKFQYSSWARGYILSESSSTFLYSV